VHGPAAAANIPAHANQWENVLREIESGTATAAYTVARPTRAYAGLHRWISDPQQPLPAWVELRWPEPVAFREVQLVFDTGLHRFLTLSQADGYTRRMHWGEPQPETVRDYRLEAECGGTWVELHVEHGNFLRRRVHDVQLPGRASALRVTVLATNGSDTARVNEIRVY
jgi:hypothetical protein